MNHLSPAYLWIGPHLGLVEKTITFLQQILCPAHGNDHCFTCQQIAQQQHHATLWLTPTKNYTIEQLEPITKRIIFSLEANEHCFFVIQHADYLSHACSNSLLKSVEEPPRGYHFIFLAEKLDAITPTIRSRCIVQSFFSDEVRDQHPLFSFFTSSTFDPLKFERELSSSKITEQESATLVNALLSYWMGKYKAELVDLSDEASSHVRTSKDKLAKAEQKITILTDALKKLPMPGSSTIFWRNIFLKFMETAKDKAAHRYVADRAHSKQTVF